MNDLGFALRQLLKNPGFTAAAVLTLALGIGANTAIFSIINAVQLRPLPYAAPEQLVTVSECNPERGLELSTVSVANFQDWRQQNDVFEGLAAVTLGATVKLQIREKVTHVHVASASVSLFPLLRVRPILGRTFLPEEEAIGKHYVALISERLWAREFSRDPKVIGRSLVVNGADFVVVGVLPEEFKFLHPEGIHGWKQAAAETEIWRPIWAGAKWEAGRGTQRECLVVGRLKNGVTLNLAQNQMNVVATRLAQQYPDSNRGWGVAIRSLHEQVVSNSRPALLMLLAAVGFLLLIAVVNVANLLLARSSARQKEFAVRTALGAGQWRIIRQLLTESMLLAILGGALGLALGRWGLELLVVFSPASLSRVEEIRLDGAVLGFASLLALFSGLASGLASALHAARQDLHRSLKGASAAWLAGFRGRGFGQVFVVTEVALALILLVGASLMLSSFSRLRSVNPGFQAVGLLAADVLVAGEKYTERETYIDYVTALLRRVEKLPGVQSVATINGLPFGSVFESDLEVHPERGGPPGNRIAAAQRHASPGYFATMGIPLLQGREFSERDLTNSIPVVVINEALARRLPNTNLLGRRVFSDSSQQAWEIVGIVRDVNQAGLDVPPRPELYRAHLQTGIMKFSLIVRAATDPLAVANSVRQEIAALDPDVSFSNPRTMEQQLDRSVSPRRFSTVLLALFASVALSLGAVGIYGVISYSMSQRTREIGIRMALGANRSDVLRFVLKQGLVLTLSGTAIGLCGSMALTRLLTSQLYGVTPTDPLAFAGVTLLMVVVALAACYLPARRAAKVDPMEALRYE